MDESFVVPTPPPLVFHLVIGDRKTHKITIRRRSSRTETVTADSMFRHVNFDPRDRQKTDTELQFRYHHPPPPQPGCYYYFVSEQSVDSAGDADDADDFEHIFMSLRDNRIISMES